MENPENIKTWADVIKELIPLISVIVVGLTACLSPILTGRANRKLANESNAYIRKKEALDDFSKACARFCGIISTYFLVLNTDDTRYRDDIIRSLNESKWEILKSVDPSVYVKIYDMLVIAENHVTALSKRCDEIWQQGNDAKSALAEEIKDGSLQINEDILRLQELLIEAV